MPESTVPPAKAAEEAPLNSRRRRPHLPLALLLALPAALLLAVFFVGPLVLNLQESLRLEKSFPTFAQYGKFFTDGYYLMVLLHIGSMPHELTLENMELFAREVLPSLRGAWDDDGWVNHWWPERLRDARRTPVAAGVAGGA